jgi:hypothetical protein
MARSERDFQVLGLMANQPVLAFARTTTSPRSSNWLLSSFTTLSVAEPPSSWGREL